MSSSDKPLFPSLGDCEAATLASFIISPTIPSAMPCRLSTLNVISLSSFFLIISNLLEMSGSSVFLTLFIKSTIA